MNDDTLLLLLGALWAWSRYSVDVVPALEQGGASLYEKLHPSEKNHANDLPGKRLTKPQIPIG